MNRKEWMKPLFAILFFKYTLELRTRPSKRRSLFLPLITIFALELDNKKNSCDLLSNKSNTISVELAKEKEIKSFITAFYKTQTQSAFFRSFPIRSLLYSFFVTRKHNFRHFSPTFSRYFKK